MAWTDVCKFNFEHACQGLILKHKISARKACKQLSGESGISLRTLQRWWEEITKEKLKKLAEQDEIEKCANNGADQEPIENNTENNDGYERLAAMSQHEEEKMIKCLSCGKEVPESELPLNGSGKAYGPKSKYHRLCAACEKRVQRSVSVGQEDGYRVVCPHCAKSHYVKWSTIYRVGDIHRRKENGK